MHYIDGIETIPDTDPENALILGTALHTGIEEGLEPALEFYQNSFPVITDDHINEMIKLEALIPKAKALLPPGAGLKFPLGMLISLGSLIILFPWDIWQKNTRKTVGVKKFRFLICMISSIPGTPAIMPIQANFQNISIGLKKPTPDAGSETFGSCLCPR
ncbi:MAG: hypothetical protein ACLRX4_12135 [Oscillospiraceae bacterium]